MSIQFLIVGETVELDGIEVIVKGISFSSYSIPHPCSAASS